MLSVLSASSAASAGTPYTDLTSLPSDVSKLSLGPAKEPPAGSWPYAQTAALDDIPGIAYALDTFLKSQMVESEEYCHRKDPQKCVRCGAFFVCFAYPYLVGNAYTSRRGLA